MKKIKDFENDELIEIISAYADLNEAYGDNPYRVRAYRRAARSIRRLKNNLVAMVKAGEDITTIPMIGKGIALLIQEIIHTGRAPEIKNYKKTKNKKTKKLRHPPKIKKFIRLYHAFPIVNALLSKLQALPEVVQVECGGEFRRRQEIVDYFPIIVSTKKPKTVINKLIKFNEVTSIIEKKENDVRVLLWSGLQAHLHCVNADHFGAALLWYTGNETHLKHLEKYMTRKKYTLQSRGLFKNKKHISSKNENAIYDKLGLPFITPELREGRGEIEAAIHNELPTLIDIKNIKGDLHCHTNETDGTETLQVMVSAAAARGYQYIAITDHSKHLAITNGLDEKRLLKQIKAIDRLNATLKNIIILKSIEVDILENGTLDLTNDVLKELDIVVASIHSKFKLPEEKQTERILRAMENPYFNILGHATGRLIKSREPYLINMKRIIQGAKDNGCFLELNSQPYRLDVNDLYAKMAKENKVKVAISSDAHSVRELNYMQFGVYQGRRGWLTPDDVINTLSWVELKKLLKQHGY